MISGMGAHPLTMPQTRSWIRAMRSLVFRCVIVLTLLSVNNAWVC